MTLQEMLEANEKHENQLENSLNEFLEENEKRQKFQDSLPIQVQIDWLKEHKKSVFTFHFKDGSKLVRGDSESNQKQMKRFFKKHPQTNCVKIEYHK